MKTHTSGSLIRFVMKISVSALRLYRSRTLLESINALRALVFNTDDKLPQIKEPLFTLPHPS